MVSPRGHAAPSRHLSFWTSEEGDSACQHTPEALPGFQKSESSSSHAHSHQPLLSYQPSLG